MAGDWEHVRSQAALCRELQGCFGITFDICDSCDHYKEVRLYNGEYEIRDSGHVFVKKQALKRERAVALAKLSEKV